MEKIVFADTFTKTFKKAFKIPKVTIDDPIFRLHYRFTGLALLFASILVSGYEFFGNPIMCIQKDQIPESLLNTYCWIEGTFTLPKALTKIVGEEIVYPGVDTHFPGDEVVEHAYYQWVCFVLLLQAAMFCVPYVAWRSMENGRVRHLVEQVKNPVMPKTEQEACSQSLACYFEGRRNEHHFYALKFLFCELLNFINVLGQIYFIDRFLGGEFRKYGIDVVNYVNEEQQNRTDPMIRVFPRITKCTFYKYGSSGTIQKHDALCLLPLNILNEKLFVVMWFWFVILAILDGCVIIYRLVIILSNQARFLLLSCVSSLTSKNDIKLLIPNFSYGDWFLMYLLADNIDNLNFRRFVQEIVKKERSGRSSTYQNRQIDEPDKGKLFVNSESSSLLEKNESCA